MASCSHCTRTLPAGAKVCPFCGKKISAAAEGMDPDKELLFRLRKNLQKERTYWKINALALLTAAFFLLIAGVLAFLEGDLPGVVAYVILILFCLLGMFLGFSQYRKTEDYIDAVYLDCYPAVDRAEGKGPMVLAAFFGWLPLIYIVKNHKFVTANRANFYRIHRQQDKQADKTFHSDFLHDWNG